MVSQVTSSVAHSFNDILSTVLLASENLRKQIVEHSEVAGCQGAPCDAASIQRFSNIELAVKEGLSIVERLNAWTRLDQGVERERGGASVFDPAELLREAWSYAQPQWVRCNATRDLELVWDLAETANVSGDRTELREVLLNLILNAVDAMPRGGTLTLRLASGSERVRFIIQDTGIGIAEDQLERIFEPTFSTKGAAGTGLGL